MTSSVLDGAGCESPAPPAFSPLTDPADPGNREPSVNVSLDPDPDPDPSHGQEHAGPEHEHERDRDRDRDRDHGDRPAASPPAAAARPNGHLPQPDLAGDVRTPPPPPRPPVAAAVGDAMDLDMTMAPSMDYAPATPGLDMYSQHPTQLLMALARLSAATQQQQQQQQQQQMVLTPSTVRPSQVSLPPQSVLGGAGAPVQAADAASSTPPADVPLESFARIEFADSVFQMTTYAVIIGRDQRALEQARRDERRLEEYQRRLRESEQLGLPAPSPPTQDRGKFSKSYVSEEGGMLGPESDGGDNPRPAKRRKTSGGAASASGDSHQQDAAAGEQPAPEEKNQTFNRQYVSHTPGAAAVNLSALRPSPYYVPFIGIHSPGPNIASRTKAISREHLKIQFNPQEGVFEAIPLHKNGFFCQDVHYRDEKVVLRSGDRLQIKDVDFVFIINGVPRGKTGAEDCLREDRAPSRRYSEGGKEMSFEFESSHDPGRRSTSPEEEVAAPAANADSDSELSDPPKDIREPTPEPPAKPQEVMETIEKDPETQPPIKPEIPLELLADLPPIPKKRGPGRPPKNGIMSKREERLRKKAAMELAKKNMPQPPPGDPPVKRKVGRPRKHPLPENATGKPEKRKYKPRKSKTGEEGGSDVEKTIKERRREKPKTPPLELRREDYTEEQLQKPNKNYGVLIDEVLSAAPGGLTLKQIYKRIQMKYPFYYFNVDTKGWESSVRHNLIGNDAFRKNEETHLWSRVPGIDIDAGKKRKATSPDQSNNLNTFGQQYRASATPSAQMYQGDRGAQQGYRPGTVPQQAGYGAGAGQAALAQNQQHHLGAQAAGAAGQMHRQAPYPNSAQVSGTAPGVGYGNPAAARPPQGGAQTTAYPSPYASRPPSTSAAQPGVARQGVPPHHVPSPFNGLPRTDANASHAHPGAHGPAGARQAQPGGVNGSALALKPAVAPELVRHVTNFKTTVTEQLAKRTAAAEAIAMSVINRGLGLTTESTVPTEEGLEKIVLGVFESSRKKLGANQALHPGLVQALVNFKNSMTKTLEPRMGKLNSERLILSAVDRVLGFADRSTMPGSESERKQYDEAETVLIPAIRRVVSEHQRTLAAVASVAAGPPGHRPGPSPSPAPAPAPGATPNAAFAKGSAPPPVPPASSAHPATAHPNFTAKPMHAAPVPGYPAPASARPPVSASAQAPMANKPVAMAAPPQQSPPVSTPAPAASQAVPAPPSSQALAPGPGTGAAQAPSRTVAPGGTQVPAPAPAPVAPQAPAQAPVRAPGQIPAQTPVSAPVQTAAPPTASAPTTVSAPTVSQAPGQSAPPQTSAAPTAPQAPSQNSGTAISQSAVREPTPAKPQSPVDSAVTNTSHNLGQGVRASGAVTAAGQSSAQPAAPVPAAAPPPALTTTSQPQTAPTTAPQSQPAPAQAPAQAAAQATASAPAPTPTPAPTPAPAPAPASASSASSSQAQPTPVVAAAQAPDQPAAQVPPNKVEVATAASAAGPPPTPPPSATTATETAAK